LVAIPLSYSRVLLERQSELEALIQNILSATSLEKLIKAESVQRFLGANLEPRTTGDDRAKGRLR
jgi:hypothetical protein